MPSSQRGVLGLETPGDEGRKPTGFFLQIVKPLKMVDTMFPRFAYAKHHGGGRPHTQSMGGAVDLNPILGQTFQACDPPANLIIENLRSSSRYRIEARVSQTLDRILDRQAADGSKMNDFRGGKTMQVD